MALESATTTLATIQMRRGAEENFDPDQMTAGEWAVSTDTKYVRMCFMPGLCLRMATYEAFEKDMEEIRAILVEAQDIQLAIQTWFKLAESYAHGGTGAREGEETDNAKYYAEQAKISADNAAAVADIGIMTTEKAGIGKPDGETIIVDEDGTMHSVGGGGGSEGDFASKAIYGDESINLGRVTGSTVGSRSSAYGAILQATGYFSHAEGRANSSANNYAHTEGGGNIAIGLGSHAEGLKTISGNGYILSAKSHDSDLKKIVFDETYEGFSEAFSKVAVGMIIHALNKKYLNDAFVFTVGEVLSSENAVIYTNSPTDIIEPGLCVLPVKNTSNATTHSEGRNTLALSDCSHSEGYSTKSTGYCAHSEGNQTESTANQSHAEGFNTKATGNQSHSEGYATTASGKYSHSGGLMSTAIGDDSFAHGNEASASNAGAVAFGFETHAKGAHSFACGSKTTASGECSFCEGRETVASGVNSHAEGLSTNAKSSNSHAEGYGTEAFANQAHAEGYNTHATGDSSHAEGYGSIASGNYSHACGFNTKASGYASTACGLGTIAGGQAQVVIGMYNTEISNPSLYPFVIGRGSSVSNRANIFQINSAGNVFAKGIYGTLGADYAEFIREWHDGNSNNEDRVGYFVTVKDEYLYKANEGDYIVGITSGNPSVVGNSDIEYYWRWERDEFNRIIYEEKPEMTEEIDEDGHIVIDEETGNPVMVETGNMISVPKQRSDYDISKQTTYIERKDRPEWDYVGMVGVLPVRDDGTCEVGKFCKCADGGIATLATERGFDTYMVIERVSENIVSVVLK